MAKTGLGWGVVVVRTFPLLPLLPVPMNPLPKLHYRTSGLPPEQAYGEWRQLMAPMYGISPIPGSGVLPGGGVTAYLLGDILANRTVFSSQLVSRDKKRVDTTPDHLVVQFWRNGGTRGEVAGRTVSLGSGQVALANRRHQVDSVIVPSDTTGFVVPRSLLSGLDIDAIGLRLDPARNRLLAAQVLALYRRLPVLDVSEIPAVRHELLGALRRVVDPSPAADVLEGPEFDTGLKALAERFILANLGLKDLSPQVIADDLRTSRATLYRAFASQGGIMAHVQEQRLLAVREALSDPLETRSITRLAEDYGFGTIALLSRSFSRKFGNSPRAWRDQHVRPAEGAWSIAPIQGWWSSLGRRA